MMTPLLLWMNHPSALPFMFMQKSIGIQYHPLKEKKSLLSGS